MSFSIFVIWGSMPTNLRDLNKSTSKCIETQQDIIDKEVIDKEAVTTTI